MIRTKQNGFALVGLIAALAILSLVMMRLQSVKQSYDEAEAVAADALVLSEYVNGVRRYLSGNHATIVDGRADEGIEWLQAYCPDQQAGNYLPCDFVVNTHYRFDFKTTWHKEVDSSGAQYASATISFGPLALGGQSGEGARADLAGLLVKKANAALLPGAEPINDSYRAFSFNRETAEITATVSTQVNFDSWLRRDGSNKATADIDLDDNQLLKVKDIALQLDDNTSIWLRDKITYLDETVIPGANVKKPVCREGSVPDVDGAVGSIRSSNHDPESLKGFNAYAEDLGDEWKIHVGIIVGKEMKQLPENELKPLAKIHVTTRCNPKG